MIIQAYKWWLDDMYLLNSSALPINSNPGMVFPKTTFSDKNEQLRSVIIPIVSVEFSNM